MADPAPPERRSRRGRRRRPALLGLLSGVALLAVLVGLWGSPGRRTGSGEHDLLVSPRGDDRTATGRADAPFASLAAAVAAAQPGDRVLVGGGDYPIGQPAVVVAEGLTIAAVDGEVPVFDGSIPVGSATPGPEGTVSITYQPVPAGLGHGVTLFDLPGATFGPDGPTGLAAERGWRCVTGDVDYTLPEPTATDPTGCPAGARATVITGYYPDQVWVGQRRLTQVLDPALVAPGRFFVARTAATDAAPPPGTLLLSAEDARDLAQVRVSRSSGPFLSIRADGVTVRGLQVQRHSPSWSSPAVAIAPVAGTTVQDLRLADIASVGVGLQGRATDGGALVSDTTIEGLVSTGAGWSAMTVTYSDDTSVVDSQFVGSDPDGEFAAAPLRGAIKATKNHRMAVIGSRFADNSSYGLWWDQSNYDVTLADSTFTDNGEAALFFEISHGLTMVNNLVTGVRAGPSVRLAGSSGLRLVNNTIVGGQVGVAVLTDARSRDYVPGRPCSEHPARYGQPGDLAVCSITYASDLDRVRTGAFGGPDAVDQTPGLDWRPQIDLLLNNVIADPTGGSSCAVATPVCVLSFTRWTGRPTEVPMNSILTSATVLDGNVYQSDAPIAVLATPAGQAGSVRADDLLALRGPGGLGGPYFGLTAEEHGRQGAGWVTPDGRPSDRLTAVQGQGAPVPADPAINRFVSAGSRNYGQVGLTASDATADPTTPPPPA